MWGFDKGFMYGEECDSTLDIGDEYGSCSDYGNGGLRCKGADGEGSGSDYGNGYMYGFDSGFSYGSAGCQGDNDDGTSGDD